MKIRGKESEVGATSDRRRGNRRERGPKMVRLRTEEKETRGKVSEPVATMDRKLASKSEPVSWNILKRQTLFIKYSAPVLKLFCNRTINLLNRFHVQRFMIKAEQKSFPGCVECNAAAVCEGTWQFVFHTPMKKCLYSGFLFG